MSRASPAARPGTGLRGRVLVMAEDGAVVAHLVTDQALAAGRDAGRYTALCGTTVLPGSLVEQSSDHCCRGCIAVVARQVI